MSIPIPPAAGKKAADAIAKAAARRAAKTAAAAKLPSPKLPVPKIPAPGAVTPPKVPGPGAAGGGSLRASMGGKPRAMAGRNPLGKSLPTGTPATPPSIGDQAKQLGKTAVKQVGQDRDMSAKDKAKSIAGDVSKGAAAGAAAGAAMGAAAGGVGAAPGAAVGAAKGAVQALVFNKHARNLLIMLVVILIAVPVGLNMALISLATVAGTSLAASDDSHSAETVVDSGQTEDLVTDARKLTSGSTIPWQVAAAIKAQTGSPADIPALSAAIDSADPGSKYRYLGAGTFYSSGSVVRVQGDAEMAEKVQKVWTEAIAAVLDGDTVTAGIVFQQALVWFLGQSFGTCTFGGSGSSQPALDTEQLSNAKLITGVAKSAFATDPERRQAAIVAVATAMQESSLRNLDHGDLDSLGLFQQRASWGSADERQTPAYAAGKFFAGLAGVSGWDKLPVTEAAQAVQRSAYPDAYAKWESLARTTVLSTYSSVQAVEIPTAVGHTFPEAIDPVDGAGGVSLCVGANLVVDGDTTLPVLNYIVSSEFGYRIHPISGALRLHAGIDLAKSGCTSVPQVLEPIYAARAGEVIVTVNSNGKSGYGTQVDIDHGDGLVTRYGHMIYNSLFVKVGDMVQAGTQIGFMGTTGPSTGCHLHFETIINGVPVNPRIVMMQFGVTF